MALRDAELLQGFFDRRWKPAETAAPSPSPSEPLTVAPAPATSDPRPLCDVTRYRSAEECPPECGCQQRVVIDDGAMLLGGRTDGGGALVPSATDLLRSQLATAAARGRASARTEPDATEGEVAVGDIAIGTFRLRLIVRPGFWDEIRPQIESLDWWTTQWNTGCLREGIETRVRVTAADLVDARVPQSLPTDEDQAQEYELTFRCEGVVTHNGVLVSILVRVLVGVVAAWIATIGSALVLGWTLDYVGVKFRAAAQGVDDVMDDLGGGDERGSLRVLYVVGGLLGLGAVWLIVHAVKS